MPPHRHPSIDPLDADTWPDRCPDARCGAELTVTRQCMGHVDDQKTGEFRHCGKPAMKGQTYCRSHGGAIPAAKKAAEKRVQQAAAKKELERLGIKPRLVEAADALLEEMSLSCGAVDLLAQLVDEEGREGLTQWGVNGRTESVYWSMLVEARKMKLAAAKACVAAKIADRQVQLAESQGRVLAEVVRQIVTGLGRDLADPEVRQVVEPALRLVPRAA